MTKLLFLPNCLEDNQKQRLETYGQQHGYEVHVVKGGSAVKRVLGEYEIIDVIVGVACVDEIELSRKFTDSFRGNGTRIAEITLLAEGCEETSVDLEKVVEAL